MSKPPPPAGGNGNGNGGNDGQAEVDIGAAAHTAALIANASSKVPTVNIHTEGFQVMARLTRLVVKSFYHGPEILLFDQLLAKGSITRAELLTSMKFQPRQLDMLLKPLLLERLITEDKTYTKISQVIEEGKTTLDFGDLKGEKILYYSPNFKGIVDSVTYRILMMLKAAEKEIEGVSKNGLVCSQCGNTYTDDRGPALGFVCPRQRCDSSVRLEAIDVDALREAAQAKEIRLNQALAPITALLRDAARFVWHKNADGHLAVLTHEQAHRQEREDAAAATNRNANLGLGKQRITATIRPDDDDGSHRGSLTRLPRWMLAPAVPPTDPSSPRAVASRFARDAMERQAQSKSQGAQGATHIPSAALAHTTTAEAAAAAGAAFSALARSQRVLRKLDEAHIPDAGAASSSTSPMTVTSTTTTVTMAVASSSSGSAGPIEDLKFLNQFQTAHSGAAPHIETDESGINFVEISDFPAANAPPSLPHQGGGVVDMVQESDSDEDSYDDEYDDAEGDGALGAIFHHPLTTAGENGGDGDALSPMDVAAPIIPELDVVVAGTPIPFAEIQSADVCRMTTSERLVYDALVERHCGSAL